MNKKANRALSILLALIMIVGLLPISAFAENDPPAAGTDIVVEELTNSTEEPTKETASPTAPGELPGTGEGKVQGENQGGEDKTAESSPTPQPTTTATPQPTPTATPQPTPTATPEPTPTPTPEPSKAPAKQAAPALKGGGSGTETYSVTITDVNSTQATVSGAGAYKHGETATVRFAFNNGWNGAFIGWFVNGSKVADDMEYSFTVTEDLTLRPKYMVTSEPTGVLLPGGGKDSTGGKGGIPALPGHGENNNDPGPATYPVTLVCDPTGGGSITIQRASPTSGNTERFAEGETVWLSIKANSGYAFKIPNGLIVNGETVTAREGGAVPGQYTASFTMPGQEAKVEATFESAGSDTYTVKVIGGRGSGSYAVGATVIIEATRSTFKEWSGADGLSFTSGSAGSRVAEFTMPARNVTLEAIYDDNTQGKYTVRVSADPSAGGTVTGGGTVTEGRSATVKATANSGYSFDGWYKGTAPVSTDNPYTFTPAGDITLTAKFKQDSAANGKLKTKLFVKTGPTVVDPSESAGFGFIITTEDEQPLPAGTVKASQLTLPPQATLDLDAEYNTGVVELPASALSTGANTLSLSWAGDESYEGCSATVTFTVANKQSLRLVEYAATLGKPGEPYTISGRFLDGNNRPLADTEITIRTQQEPGSTSMLPWFVDTDKDGRFSYTVSQNLMYIHEGDTLDVELIVHATDAYLRFEKKDQPRFTGTPSTQYTVTVTAEPAAGGTVSVPNGGKVTPGESTTVTAAANPGYVFEGWYKVEGENRSLASAAAAYSFTPAADTELVALFLPLQSISVKQGPNKTDYVHGDALVTTGLVITCTYGNTFGSTISNDIDSGFTVQYNKGDCLRYGDTEVTLEYRGKSCTLSGLSVGKKELTVSGWQLKDRAYDGTPLVYFIYQGAPSGVVGNDHVAIQHTNNFVVAEDQYAGENKPVTARYAFFGDDADNYTLKQPSMTVNIFAAEQNPSVTATADLLSGGKTLDLKTLVKNAQGDVSFSIADNETDATLDSTGQVLSTGILCGEVVLNIHVSAVDYNKDGDPEYKALEKEKAITVTVAGQGAKYDVDITYYGGDAPEDFDQQSYWTANGLGLWLNITSGSTVTLPQPPTTASVYKGRQKGTWSFGWRAEVDVFGSPAVPITNNSFKMPENHVSVYGQWTFTPNGSAYPEIVTAALPDGMTDSDYQATVFAHSGPEIDTWTVGGLPNGLSYRLRDHHSLLIEGTPRAAGVYSVTVRAENNDGYDERPYTLTVKQSYALQSSVIPDGAGTVTFKKGDAEVTRACEGDDLTVSWEPEIGYARDDFMLKMGNDPVDLVPLGTGSPVTAWSFTMPASDVTATAIFKQATEIVFQNGDGSSDTCEYGTAYELRFTLKHAGSAISKDYLEKIQSSLVVDAVPYNPDANFKNGEYILTLVEGQRTVPGQKLFTVDFSGDGVYAGCNGDFTLTVLARAVRIKLLRGEGAKTVYYEGESLDVTDLSLEVTREDGTSGTIPVTADMVDGFDSSKPGRQLLTVTYGGCTDTCEITVKAAPYTVTVEADPPAGGTVTGGGKVDVGRETTVTATANTGYVFDGWYEGTVEKSMDASYKLTPVGNITLTAKFTPLSSVSYSVTDGADSTWTKDSGETLRVTVERSPVEASCFSHFTGVEIDGTALVRDTDYTASSGSTIVTLKAETLQALSTGSHIVTIKFDDGSATVKLTVKAAAAQPTPSPTPKPSKKPTSPKTGDESNLALWSSLMFLSVAAMIVLLPYTRKRKTEK